MSLKIYVDRLSQPSRAVLIFCKVNKIDFEEVRVDLSKGKHLTPEFAEINPQKQVPAIVDGRFKLSESHAILIYLSCAFPGVADHWYPADLSKRAKIHSVLDWHHMNLRRGAMTYAFNTVIASAFGRPSNPQAAEEGKQILISSLSKLEKIWLKGSGKFLLGSYQPSIADLSLVCEIMQLELLEEEDYARILSPYKKVKEWIEATKIATKPHFEDVHGVLFKAKANFQKHREMNATLLRSKI
ncbi:hypothetical protein vseg_020229 [Gypsophila vaccaria]